jgi:Arc/MetJ-type ribon-helix-helix transcriptional regulator
MSQIAVQLPAELDAFVESSIAPSDYAGPNELVTQALYAYSDRIKLQRLRRDIQTGIDQIERGEFVTDFDVERFLAERRTKHPRTSAAA